MTLAAKKKLESSALKIRAALMSESLPEHERRELAIVLCMLAVVTGNPFLATSLDLKPA